MTTITRAFEKFRNNLPTELMFKLNQLVATYERRVTCRRKAAQYAPNLETARRDYAEWGHFDDCGPSYEQEYREAQAKVEEWIPAKIASEKMHKRASHEFLEAGATPEQLNEATRLLVQIFHGNTTK
jgi:hypothetical protein